MVALLGAEGVAECYVLNTESNVAKLLVMYSFHYFCNGMQTYSLLFYFTTNQLFWETPILNIQ